MRIWSKNEILWLCSFIFLVILSQVLSEDLKVISVISAISGVLCVVMVAKGMIENYIFGFIGVTTYAYIAYHSNYYGDYMLNLFFYAPIQIIGFIVWRKNMDKKTSTVKVGSMPKLYIPFILIFLVVGTILYAKYVLIPMGNAFAYGDSFTTVASLLAQTLMLLRYKEQWLVWIIINIVSIYMWVVVRYDPAIALMWGAYLINATYGWIKWNKFYTTQKKLS